MLVIGITGGVGAGKSEVLGLLCRKSKCFVLKADEVAKELEEPGRPCYRPLIDLLGDKILDDSGRIVPKLMSAAIFESGDEAVLKKVNSIVHPAVKREILCLIDDKREAGEYDFFFLEAALLIEDGYETICDELWYVYAGKRVRRKRLMLSRGYSKEKIDSIFASQLDERTFRRHCKRVIDNNGDIAETSNIIDEILELYK